MKKLILIVMVALTTSLFSCTTQNDELEDDQLQQIDPSNDGRIDPDPEEETGDE